MSQPCKIILLIAAVSCVSCLFATGQDSQSLGDVARQARQQKQNKATPSQSKTGTATPTSKVITNDEIAGRSEPITDAPANVKHHEGADSAQPSSGAKVSGDEWKSQIRNQKQVISTLQGNIDKLNNSIHYTTGNCVSGCVQWNERQQQKQQEVERMREQLEQQKQHLQDMQESARQQGYGSSVYDP